MMICVHGGAGILKTGIVADFRKNHRNRLLKMSLFIFGYLLSFVFLCYGHEVWGGVIALGILTFIGLGISKLNILHPFTWFIPLFFLYSVSMPVLVGVGEWEYVEGIKQTLIIEWVALITLMVVFLKEDKKKVIYDPRPLYNLKVIIIPLYFITLGLTMVHLMYVYSNGLSDKYAISLDQSIFNKLGSFFTIYILCFILLLAYNLIIKKKIPKFLILFTFCYALMALLILGERDIILRVVLSSILLLHVFHKPLTRKAILLLGVGILAIIPMLSNLKNFAFGGVRTTYEDASFLVTLFGSEFISASRNLNKLIMNQDMWSYFYGKTILWDINKATFGSGDSPGVWFNKVFYPNLIARGGGNGFTVVGEGYMNFGVFGVILVFVFIGFLLKYLYKKALQNVLWLVIYVTSIPIFIYVIRADLATLLTQISKHIIFPILIVYVVKRILEKPLISVKDGEDNVQVVAKHGNNTE